MSDRLWEYGGYWIGRAGGTAQLYAYWYDKRKRRSARRSLATEILAEAQEKLIELVGSIQIDGSRSPDKVMIMSVLDHYYEHEVKHKPSGDQAFRAITLVREFLKQRMDVTASVASFGPIRQREFMEWSRDRPEGHGASYIARNLSVVSSAFHHAKKLVVVIDTFGTRHEVKMLDDAPDVVTQGKTVAKTINLAIPKPRHYLPTMEEFGAFITSIDKRQENLFRFVILSLNTWARPETVIDLRDTPAQVNRRFGTIDLNPAGREQTDKYRPVLPLTDNLRDWLDHWKMEAPLSWNGKPIITIKRTFKRQAEDIGLTEFTQGTIRHFMATYCRREKPRVHKEQRDVWLGHDEKRTANSYESFDPEYLAECAQATESIISQLQKHTPRPLFACKLRASSQLRSVVGNIEIAKSMIFEGQMVGVTGIEPVTPTMST